ncbi:response regulator [Vineibacter terrae]|uniref:Response regulator n=1 Tax=Vineibacter terrae TaxID=2586908 RepID=A0A5C8PC31_9HYPH|nr:response regulator [Vineibacter terrae]
MARERRLSLSGTRVFVVEDEALLVLALEDLLSDMGCDLVGHAQQLEDALSKASALDFDVAILDVNLGGVRSDPVGEALARRGIPFVFVSGYGEAALPAGFRDCPLVNKPYAAASLQAGLLQALGRRDPNAAASTAGSP